MRQLSPQYISLRAGYRNTFSPQRLGDVPLPHFDGPTHFSVKERVVVTIHQPISYRNTIKPQVLYRWKVAGDTLLISVSSVLLTGFGMSGSLVDSSDPHSGTLALSQSRRKQASTISERQITR